MLRLQKNRETENHMGEHFLNAKPNPLLQLLKKLGAIIYHRPFYLCCLFKTKADPFGNQFTHEYRPCNAIILQSSLTIDISKPGPLNTSISNINLFHRKTIYVSVTYMYIVQI